MKKFFLNEETKEEIEYLLNNVIASCINWKISNKNVKKKYIISKKMTSIPKKETDLDEVIKYLLDNIEYNTNFSSRKFMGFPDSGNSLAGLIGSIFEVFLQQNMINETICAPFATQIELETIQWLRELVGYPIEEIINNSIDIAGSITNGGVMSNTYAIMAAAKKYKNKDIMILPENIGHYSLSYSPEWLNLNKKIIYCKVKNFKLDLDCLENIFQEYGNRIFFLGLYACDSRTSTCDNLEKICELKKEKDIDLWLHCDACHGFLLLFSKKYNKIMEYLKYFDSCTMDPHKVLWLPYTISVILFKDRNDFSLICKENELIMNTPYALGKTTPFIGSKTFNSLKLWMFLKNAGVKNIGIFCDTRIKKALDFKEQLILFQDFDILIDKILFSVIFHYKKEEYNIEQLNIINKKIYEILLEEGIFYFHGFTIEINGIDTFVLRYNSGNMELKNKDIIDSLKYIKKLGDDIIEQFRKDLQVF